MADIITVEKAKVLLKIIEADQDAHIAALIPPVQDDLLTYLNNDFTNEEGVTTFPPALEMYMVRMLNFRMQGADENIKSEHLSRWSGTYNNSSADVIAGYPAAITSGLSKWRKLNWGRQ
jgi:hypothetical protein